MERATDNGRAFKAKFRQRIRQGGSQASKPREQPRPPPLPKMQQYDHLYKRDQQANIINVISVISEEIPPNKRISVYPRIHLDDAPVIGQGATFEVLTKKWRKDGETKLVAVKRIRRDHIPNQNQKLPLKDDYVYLKERELFYSKVEDILQELKIMANGMRLFDLAWDSIDDTLFAPIMIVELACSETPTLHHYFQSRDRASPICQSTVREFIADVADGLTALHFSNVLHSDLKPSNILLFQDGSSQSLVAKISDFGYADSNRMVRKEDSEVRGGTREWAAPELLPGCPEPIRTLARVAPTASDIFSFGLLVFYMAMEGMNPSKIGSWTMEQLDEVKFNGDTFTELEKHSALHISKSNNPLFSEIRIVSAIKDSLKLDPTMRLATLGGIRAVLFQTDQYERQKVEDKFRARPFVNYVAHSLPLGSIIQPNISLNKIALDTLPSKLRVQVQKIIGRKAGLFEPMAHSIRRDQFFPATKDDITRSEQMPRLSIDRIQFLPSLFTELHAIAKMVLTQPFMRQSSKTDLLQTECLLRPNIFTFIDGNNISAIRQELLRDPSQAMMPLPTEAGGWYPLHLAAELGRVDIVKLFLGIEGVSCDVRSGLCQLTPLHLAVESEEPAIVQLLLNAGAQIDARYYIPNSGYMRDMTALDLAVESFDESRGGLKKRMEIIRLLLQHGADYLHNNAGRGFSVVFRALKNLDLLKVFFDSIPPEEARLLVTIIDDLGSTLLSAVATARQVDIVKYLLSKGADPSVRDRIGRTIFARLKGDEVFEGSVLGILDQGMPYLMGKTPRQWSKETRQILELINASGGLEVTVYDDFCFSSNEVAEIFERARTRHSKSFASRMEDAIKSPSFPRLLRHVMLIYGELASQIEKTQSMKFEVVAWQLKQQLLSWDNNRKTGRISMDVLPEEWQKALSYFGNISPGLWEEVFVKEDIPQIAKLLELTLVSILDKFFRYNGFEVIHQLFELLEEVDKRDLMEEFFISINAVGKALFSLRKHGPRSIWLRSLLGLHVKKAWRILSTGEILDRVFDILITIGIEENVDQTLRNLHVVLDAEAVAPLASTIHTLRLPERYPGSSMFITGTSLNIWPVRMLLAFIQIILFTFPIITYSLQWYLVFWYPQSMTMLLLQTFWRTERPMDWVGFDECQIHPNIYHGIWAALCLLIFRVRHPWTLEEPLIISVPNHPTKPIDMASAMHYIPAGRKNVFYFLSISSGCKRQPLPCYTAMGELIDRWSNGTLPRKGWCNGWWELDQSKEWVRVNAAGRPSWRSYSEASKEIKEILHQKQRDGVYENFLRERDYWLDTPAEQLGKMKRLFGEEDKQCFQIWARLYIREPTPRSSGSFIALPALHTFLQSVADYSWYSTG